MVGRRPIKQAHERFYIDAFLRWHQKVHHSKFAVVSMPDPPDAIIQSRTRTSWIEVGDVFWTDEWARDVNSFATPGEVHVPIHAGTHMNMDKIFAKRFVAVLKKKLSLTTYKPTFEQFGPGYLILPTMYPLFDGDTVHAMKVEWEAALPILNHGLFRGVFFSFRSMGDTSFKRWRVGR